MSIDIYQLIFSTDDSYFPAVPFAGLIRSFSIIPVQGNPEQADPRTEHTVTYVIRRVFDSEPDTILTYICSLTDDRERLRWILFNRWYKKHGRGYTQISHSEVNSRLYAMAIFREHHPDESAIETLFTMLYEAK